MTEPAAPPQALFLDRDGTIICWKDYLRDPDEVELTPGVAVGLRRAKESGCLLFIHTNQSGVGRGYFGMNEVTAVNERMFELLGVGREFFDEICIAPDNPAALAETTYRKPSPRFEREMMERYRLRPEVCRVVGDNPSDAETGVNAGMPAVGLWSEKEEPWRRELFLALGAELWENLGAYLEAVFPRGGE